MCKLHFEIKRYKFEKKVGRRFPNLPKSNPFQSSPVLSIQVPSWLSCVLFEFFYSFEPLFLYVSLFDDHLISVEIA